MYVSRTSCCLLAPARRSLMHASCWLELPLQLIWVANQTPYITARDLDAATANQVKQVIQQQEQQQQQNGQQHSSAPDPAEQQQPEQQDAAAGAVASSTDGWHLVPYGVTPALQQWMAEHQVSTEQQPSTITSQMTVCSEHSTATHSVNPPSVGPGGCATACLLS